MSAVEKWLLHLSIWTSAGTGLIYLIMKHLLRSEDPFSVVNHPWQPHVLAAHVLLTPLLIFSLGLIAREHVLGRFQDERPHRSRRSGVATIALAAPMIASGYLMQVVTEPALRRVLAGAHIATGVLYTLLFASHLVLSRPDRRRSNGHGAAGAGARPRRRRHRLDCPGGRGVGSSHRLQSTTTPAGPEGMTP